MLSICPRTHLHPREQTNLLHILTHPIHPPTSSTPLPPISYDQVRRALRCWRRHVARRANAPGDPSVPRELIYTPLSCTLHYTPVFITFLLYFAYVPERIFSLLLQQRESLSQSTAAAKTTAGATAAASSTTRTDLDCVYLAVAGTPRS